MLKVVHIFAKRISLYDVEFVDGSCVSVFNGCDDTAAFTFQTAIDAATASQVLLVYVEYLIALMISL